MSCHVTPRRDVWNIDSLIGSNQTLRGDLWMLCKREILVFFNPKIKYIMLHIILIHVKGRERFWWHLSCTEALSRDDILTHACPLPWSFPFSDPQRGTRRKQDVNTPITKSSRLSTDDLLSQLPVIKAEWGSPRFSKEVSWSFETFTFLRLLFYQY